MGALNSKYYSYAGMLDALLLVVTAFALLLADKFSLDANTVVLIKGIMLSVSGIVTIVFGAFVAIGGKNFVSKFGGAVTLVAGLGLVGGFAVLMMDKAEFNTFLTYIGIIFLLAVLLDTAGRKVQNYKGMMYIDVVVLLIEVVLVVLGFMNNTSAAAGAVLIFGFWVALVGYSNDAEPEANAIDPNRKSAKKAMKQKAKKDAEIQAKKERDAKLEAKSKKDKDKAKSKADAEDKKKAEADAKKAKEAEKKAQFEAEKKAKAEAEAKAKAEAEQKARLEAEKKAKEEAEAKARLEAEKKAKEEAEAKAKLEAEQKARLEAEQRAKEEAERKAKEEAEAKAKAEAEAKAKEEAAKAVVAAAAVEAAKVEVKTEKVEEAPVKAEPAKPEAQKINTDFMSRLVASKDASTKVSNIPTARIQPAPKEMEAELFDPIDDVVEGADDMYTDYSPEALVRRAAWNKGYRCRRDYGDFKIPVAFVKTKVAVFVVEPGADTSMDAKLAEDGWTILRFNAADVTDGQAQAEKIAEAIKESTRLMKAASAKKKKKPAKK